MTVLVVAVLAIFGVFSFALAFGQIQTRDIVPPGARKPE